PSAEDPLPRRVLDRRGPGDHDEDRGRVARTQESDHDRAGDQSRPAGTPARRPRGIPERLAADRGRPVHSHLLGASGRPAHLRLRARALRMSPDQANGEFNIATRGLNLWYGGLQALKNLPVNIKHGIITALIGPSGCGKTTFLRCGNRLNEGYGNVRRPGEIA